MTPTAPKSSAAREPASDEPVEAGGLDWEQATEQGYVGEQVAPDDDELLTVAGVAETEAEAAHEREREAKQAAKAAKEE
jgi:hypothetical protein